jgi:putative transcriptional regulator
VESRPGEPIEPCRNIGLDDYGCIGQALLSVSLIPTLIVDRALIADQIDGIRVGRRKNSANRTKHGFDFTFAVRIFAGTVREYVDPRPWDEQRNRRDRSSRRAVHHHCLYAQKQRVQDHLRAGCTIEREVWMITRKTLEQAEAERGFADLTKIDSASDTDIEQQIAEDPDLAPPTELLPELFRVRDVRRRLGLSQREFAETLSIPISMVQGWERKQSPTDPTIQTLLRILDRIPEPAMRALEEVKSG